MADVVREALKRIRAITEPARELAKWYIANPNKLYLPAKFVHLRSTEIVHLEDIAALAGIKGDRFAVQKWVEREGIPLVDIEPEKGRRVKKAVRFKDLERTALKQLPQQFPIADARSGLSYCDALMVVPEGFFRRNTPSLYMFEPIQYHHFSNALGRNSNAGSTTVFQRVGLDPDGELSIKSHQFRHWLNTLAQGSNVSQLDIAKWSGRKDIRQNNSYDHVTSEEIVAHIRSAVGDHAKVIGPLAEIPKNLPVSREEYAAMAIPTAHTTEYGFCVHDFATTPCEMFRNCLDCREHVCIKGIQGKTHRVAETLDLATAQLSMAQKAEAEGVYGATDWVATHQATVDRLTQLLGILRDPLIADGAIIQLRESGTYSLSEAVLNDRIGGIDSPFSLIAEP